MKRIVSKLAAILCFPFILLSGCATIISKSNYPIYLHSDPPGVNVSIHDHLGEQIFKGVTPTMVVLKTGNGYFKKADWVVKFSAPGYADQMIPINYKLNGWYFGNLLLGGVIGMLIVDPVTGAMWKPKDPMVNADMVKTSGTALATPSLQIIDINSLSASAKAGLIQIK